MGLLKYVLENSYILGFIILIIVIITYFDYASKNLSYVPIVLLFLSVIPISILISVIKNKYKKIISTCKTILFPYKFYYVIFLKKGIVFNTDYNYYNSQDFKQTIHEISNIYNEALLSKNYIKQDLNKNINNETLIHIVFLLIIGIEIYLNISLLIIVTSILYFLYIVYLLYTKSTSKFKKQNISKFIWQLFGILLILYPLIILVFTPGVFIFTLIFVILFWTIKNQKIKDVSKAIFNIIFLISIITVYIAGLKIFGVNYMYLFSIIILILLNVIEHKYLRYLISIPILITLIIPISIYTLILYLKQKLFPNTNEKIYYTLLNFGQNIEKIKNLNQEIITNLDNFLAGQIFSVDKIIKKNFKKINKLIEINKNLIDKNLIPLIESNKILKENVNIENLKNNNKAKIKEVIEKMIQILNNYILQISKQLNKINEIKNSNNPYKGHLILKENELNFLYKDLINQKNKLLEINNYIQQ